MCFSLCIRGLVRPSCTRCRRRTISTIRCGTHAVRPNTLTMSALQPLLQTEMKLPQPLKPRTTVYGRSSGQTWTTTRSNSTRKLPNSAKTLSDTSRSIRI
uniref:Uncharacterized protein n=1 Tax=Cacopsylla melanoneura TaxID=428564 RepID=A0A8D8LPH2_9HEMI